MQQQNISRKQPEISVKVFVLHGKMFQEKTPIHFSLPRRTSEFTHFCIFVPYRWNKMQANDDSHFFLKIRKRKRKLVLFLKVFTRPEMSSHFDSKLPKFTLKLPCLTFAEVNEGFDTVTSKMKKVFHSSENLFGEIWNEAVAKMCQVLFPIQKPTGKTLSCLNFFHKYFFLFSSLQNSMHYPVARHEKL